MGAPVVVLGLNLLCLKKFVSHASRDCWFKEA